MAKPIFTDYVDLIHTLFDKFTQARKTGVTPLWMLLPNS